MSDQPQPLVDFHCHLDLYPEMTDTYKRCGNLDCITLAVTTTPRAFSRNQLFASEFPNIHVALGLHPQAVSTESREMKLFENLSYTTRFIGEVGLDATRRHYHSFETQKKIFDKAMRICFDQGNKIISVHSARCAKHVLDVIESAKTHENCQIVMHWFSASRSDIQRAIEMGCWFSANEVFLKAEPGKRLLKEIPKNRLLTETDGPFMEVNREAALPGQVTDALMIIAAEHQMQQSQVRELIYTNLQSILHK